MEKATVDDLFADLRQQAGLLGDLRREPVREWVLSGVERVHCSDGTTLFFKHAAVPFTDEARVLDHAARHGVPVPRLVASVELSGALGMLLEDLGPELRLPTIADAAEAAVTTHRTPAPTGLALLDEAALGELPASCLASLATLRASGRWDDADDVADQLHRLEERAEVRAQFAELAPFGLCHSEFHPTSLHISSGSWRLLDWARAFQGPGLLDLASWQNTTEPPDFAAFAHLLDAYIAAGGPDDARAHRGGLPPDRWAYGWHRLWIIDWYLQQTTTWINDPATDPTYQRVIRRHLDEAIACLQPRPAVPAS